MTGQKQNKISLADGRVTADDLPSSRDLCLEHQFLPDRHIGGK